MHEFWVPGDKCDLGYQNIRDTDTGPSPEIRALLENNWEHFRPYADETFREEFSAQPDARFWEMYLCVRLLKARKNVVDRNNRPADGPDFCVIEDDGPVWIEAVTFGHGDDKNPDRVPEMQFDGVAHNVPVSEVELRISSVFIKKSLKFLTYIDQGLVPKNERQLIAINPGKTSQQASFEGRGSPMCVLYPLGDQYVTFFKDSAATDSGYHRRTEIEKASGAKVPIGMFADEQHNHLSGVIWSKTTLGNFFFRENDLTFYPNGTPISALRPGWLDWGGEWSSSVNDDGKFVLTRII